MTQCGFCLKKSVDVAGESVARRACAPPDKIGDLNMQKRCARACALPDKIGDLNMQKRCAPCLCIT